MTLKERIQAAWNNKGAIVEGFYNAYISAGKEVKDTDGTEYVLLNDEDVCGIVYNDNL
mgnify:CR=1 FL=1